MFNIVGSYNGKPFEIIDTASDQEEAIEMKRQYEIAYGNEWVIQYYNNE